VHMMRIWSRRYASFLPLEQSNNMRNSLEPNRFCGICVLCRPDFKSFGLKKTEHKSSVRRRLLLKKAVVALCQVGLLTMLPKMHH